MNQPSFQIKPEEKKTNYGRFVIEPLERGYGNTLGTSLRRILLTSLAGAAITQVKVAGLKHQFGTIKGLKEDGVDFLLNLKKVRFSYHGEKPVKAKLLARGKGQVKAGQIETSADVQVVNPDLVIANLSDSTSKLDVEMQIERGVGYSPAEERKTGTVGVIPLDADFSPVKRVSPKVEETRVGRLTNYDKLTLEIWTDGSVDPEEALKISARVLQNYLNQVISPVEVKDTKKEDKVDNAVGRLSVEELGLPTRISNALIRSGYETVSDLVTKEEELSKVRNLGGKSVKVIETALREKGVEL